VENTVDILVKIRKESEDLSRLKDEIANLKELPDEIKERWENLFEPPKKLIELNKELLRVQEELADAEERRDRKAIRASQRDLTGIQRQIEMQRELVRLKQDEFSTEQHDLMNDLWEHGVNASEIDEITGQVINPAANTYRRGVSGAYGLLNKQVQMARGDAQGAYNAAATGGTTGANQSSMQKMRDQFSRMFVEGFGGAMKQAGGAAMQQGLGGTDILSILLGFANQSKQNREQAADVATAMGLFRAGGDFFGKDDSDAPGDYAEQHLYEDHILEFADTYGVSTDEAYSMFGSGAQWLGATSAGAVRQRLQDLAPLLSYGVAPSQLALYGGLGANFTGVNSPTANVTGWMNRAVGVTNTRLGRMGGENFDDVMEEIWLQSARAGAEKSGSFTHGDLGRNVDIWMDAYSGSNYGDFMFNSPSNMMNLMQKFDSTLTGGGDDMEALLMRAYGYKGGGMTDYFKFKRRMQQGVLGTGGWENLTDVFGTLRSESGASSAFDMAGIFSNMTGENIDKLMPIMEHLWNGDYDGAYEATQDFDMDTTGQESKTTSDVMDARKNQMSANIGPLLQNLIDKVGELMQKMMKDMMPMLERVVEGIEVAVERIEETYNIIKNNNPFDAPEKRVDKVTEVVEQVVMDTTTTTGVATGEAYEYIARGESIPDDIMERIVHGTAGGTSVPGYGDKDPTDIYGMKRALNRMKARKIMEKQLSMTKNSKEAKLQRMRASAASLIHKLAEAGEFGDDGYDPEKYTWEAQADAGYNGEDILVIKNVRTGEAFTRRHILNVNIDENYEAEIIDEERGIDLAEKYYEQYKDRF